MEKKVQQYFSGERSLFKQHDLKIIDSVFADGESPLKESSNIFLENTSFQWKYPLWYSHHINLKQCMLLETARSGIWYTDLITLSDCLVEAPKTFRRSSHIKLNHVRFPNASETLWNCSWIEADDITAKGDYFAMNSQNILIRHFELSGNYCFDGAKNVEIHHAKLLSKDAFWNCENVTVYDSYIIGEYLGWNSKNVTFVNCTIESLQGLCYMEQVTLKNCKLIRTTQAFEYSNVDAVVCGSIDSILNPISGKIVCDHIDSVILDDPTVDKEKTIIEVNDVEVPIR